MNKLFSKIFTVTLVVPILLGGCSSKEDSSGFGNGYGENGGGPNNGGNPNGGQQQDGGFIINPEAGLDSGSGSNYDQPETCEQAAKSRSYIGCDYWPTVTANNVWSIFDYAVVVSNTGQTVANIHVDGPNGVNIDEQVQPGTLKTIYLPWVRQLKGPDTDSCGTATPVNQTILAQRGAYHLTSTRPVTVYQFNALEYQGKGGPPGKSWASCPGNQYCASAMGPIGCFSFSNDASLLLPSTAMTGTYRIAGANSWGGRLGGLMPSYFTITATQDQTTVEIQTRGIIRGGGGLNNLSPGQSATVTLNAGDVLEVVGGNEERDDLSGSLVKANKPIQVITGMPCRNVPSSKNACDHIEESVFPAETLGKDYLVTVPAKPRKNGVQTVGQQVRLIGNRDNTTVHFDPAISAPGVNNGTAVLQAGQVLDLGIQNGNFRVWSDDNEFMVLTLQQGGEVVDPGSLTGGGGLGDPAQSLVASVEQFRRNYVFLAPQDYTENYVNIVGLPDSQVVVDGTPVPPDWFVPIGNTGYGVVRFKLQPTGVHKLEAQKPVGIQVYGYGQYTSYQYPGGLNLKSIAPPPPK